LLKKTEVGPAEIEGRQIGPVVSETQFNKIQDLIKHGIEENAKLITGGLGRPDG
jgi:aldehyde dehydrogenase (NAD+)